MLTAPLPALIAAGLFGLSMLLTSAPEMQGNALLRAASNTAECTTESGNASLVWHTEGDNSVALSKVSEPDETPEGTPPAAPASPAVPDRSRCALRSFI